MSKPTPTYASVAKRSSPATDSPQNPSMALPTSPRAPVADASTVTRTAGQASTSPFVPPNASLNTSASSIDSSQAASWASATDTTPPSGPVAAQSPYPDPDQLSSGDLKRLASSKERTSIRFKKSDYPLPLAKALSSYAAAHTVQKQTVRIARQDLITPEKGTLIITAGCKKSPGFRADDIDRVKQVFTWCKAFADDKKAPIPEVPGQHLLEYVRLLDVAEALGVLALVRALMRKINWLTKTTLPASQIDSYLSFFNRDSEPAKWQLAVDMIAHAVSHYRIRENDQVLQDCVQRHQGLFQDYRQALHEMRVDMKQRREAQAAQKIVLQARDAQAKSAGAQGGQAQPNSALSTQSGSTQVPGTTQVPALRHRLTSNGNRGGHQG